MTSHLNRLLFLMTFLCYFKSFSQDKIYLKSSIREGKIADINATTVTYKTLDRKPKDVLVPTNKILLLFNNKGGFLAPAKMDFNQKQSQILIDQFLHPDEKAPAGDHIYIKDNKRIDGDILSEDKNFIYISVNNITDKIVKQIVVAIIYKNGRHLLYSPVASATDVLWQVKLATDMPTVVSAGDTGKKTEGGMAEKESQKPVKEQTTDTGIAVKKDPPANIPDIKADSQIKTPPDTPRKLTIEDFTKDVTKEQFIQKAQAKTQRFTDYLKILYDKSADNEEKDKTMEQAITLFVNENADVEVSSITRNEPPTHRKIRGYLQHIKIVQYDKVEVQWTNIQYVSDVRKAPDGNYYGTVEFEQVFRGYRDAQLVYSDITRKTASVMMKTYEKNYDGKTSVLWDVLLSNIGVVSTKSLHE